MAISPQLLLAIRSLITQSNPTDDKRSEIEGSIKNLNSIGQNLAPIAGGLGNILQQTSISNDGLSDPLASTIGGGIQGLAGAGLPGLLLGSIGGFAGAAQANTDYYDRKAEENAFKLSSKTTSPSIFGKGGLIGGDEFVPVQMELNENYITSDMSIYDSKAKMKHEDMTDDDITDVVENNSFAFSNRKNMKPSTHADKTLGYGFAHYAENGTFALSKVTMSDIFGDSKKEIPFSKAASMIRKAFKVIRDDDKDVDLLTQITNDENKQARVPFVTELINIHEGGLSQNDEPLVPQKFGKGGKIKKYMPGGPITLENRGPYSYVDENGNKISVDENGNESIIESFDPVDNEFGNLGLQLDNLEKYNVDNFNNTNKDTSALFGRLNTRAGISSIIQGLTTGLQSTRVDPKLQDARFIDESFEEISPAIADQVSSEGVSRANSLISNIARTSPGTAERIAPRLFDSALGQSNSSRLNILNSNLTQRRGKYKFLNKLGNANRAERIRADEATRNLVNKKRKGLANAGIGLLQNRDNLDVNKFKLDRNALRNANVNQSKIFQNRLNLTGIQGRHQLQKNYSSELLKQFEKKFKNSGTNQGVNDVDLNMFIEQILTEPIFDLPSLSEDELAYYGSLV